MTNVRHFAADCLLEARGVEAIAEMPHLESLSLGIYDLQSFEVLERISPELTSLSLGSTRSKKPGLSSLGRFRRLRKIYIERHNKGIDVLSDLQNLEDVTLRSITTPDLSYLSSLPKLWSLDIKLGGIRSFESIENQESIKYLELWQIRGLRDISVITSLPNLQHLFLQSLPQIDSFPSVSNSTALRRISLESLKGLKDLGALQRAPSLEEFIFVDARRQTPEQLLPVLENPSVRRVSAGFGSDRKNRAFAQLREKHGKVEYSWSPFDYR